MHIYRKGKRPVTYLALLMVSLLLGSMLSGCIGKEADIGKDRDKQIAAPGHKTPLEEAASVQYYFLNGSLLGSYDQEGWHSLCAPDTNDQVFGEGETFLAKDLLAQETYYVYDGQNKKQLGITKQIIWSTGTDILGGFEDMQASEKLAAYGEPYNTMEGDISLPCLFKLPVKAGQDLAGLKIPDYSFFTQFIMGSEARNECELVTNHQTDLFPRAMSGGLQATDAGARALTDLLGRNQLKNAPSNFSDCIKSDFDKDGKTESLMFANNPRSENGYPLLASNSGTDHLGVYCAMFYQDDDGSIQTLYSDLRPYQDEFRPDDKNSMELMSPAHCIYIDLMTIADLNGDGVYEILVRKSGWEYGYFLAYALNDAGQYEPVMRSNHGI